MNPDALGALIQAPGAGGGGRESTPRLILTPPLACYLCACVTSRTRFWPGPAHACADFRGATGAGPQTWGGSYPAALWETPFHPQLSSEPSKANREVSPFLGCQFQHFLRGDGSSRRAKAGFREVRLLPGLRTKG